MDEQINKCKHGRNAPFSPGHCHLQLSWSSRVFLVCLDNVLYAYQKPVWGETLLSGAELLAEV